MSTFEPAYLALHRSGELEERARRGIALLGPASSAWSVRSRMRSNALAPVSAEA